jgi:hypothetical protein
MMCELSMALELSNVTNSDEVKMRLKYKFLCTKLRIG